MSLSSCVDGRDQCCVDAARHQKIRSVIEDGIKKLELSGASPLLLKLLVGDRRGEETPHLVIGRGQGRMRNRDLLDIIDRTQLLTQTRAKLLDSSIEVRVIREETKW